MKSVMDENPVRQKILLLLKKNEGMTVEFLSSHLKITPMGVRQHLAALEKRDLVSHDTLRQGVGRPGFIYRLSEKADESFARGYARFALDILMGIENKEGREGIDKILEWRMEKILSRKRQLLDGNKSLADKVLTMTELLESEGYISDLTEKDDEYIISQYNCPISAISKSYPEACKHELDMYRELLGPDVERIRCLSEGEHVCEYRIPKNEAFSTQRSYNA
ncbi:MAG: metalloregulator ArsR/SmtB family transcription factor [Thermodesulfovibrionales bacterium]